MTHISPYHRRNLRKLRDFLRTRPDNDPKFKMLYYQKRLDSPSYRSHPNEQADLTECGSCACAIGWGPTAGIRAMRKDGSWHDYATRVFGQSNHGCGYGEYIFGVNNIDCPHEAADRIDHVLTGEYPDDL